MCILSSKTYLRPVPFPILLCKCQYFYRHNSYKVQEQVIKQIPVMLVFREGSLKFRFIP